MHHSSSFSSNSAAVTANIDKVSGTNATYKGGPIKPTKIVEIGQSNLPSETRENKWNASSDSKSNCYHIKVTIDWDISNWNETASQFFPYVGFSLLLLLLLLLFFFF